MMFKMIFHDFPIKIWMLIGDFPLHILLEGILFRFILLVDISSDYYINYHHIVI